MTNVKNSKRKRFFTKKSLIIFCLIILLLYVLFPSKKSEKTQLITEVVSKQDLVSEVITSGQLAPYKKTTVVTQVSGEIKALYIKVGDSVKKGQIIAELDQTSQQNDLDKAKNDLVSDQAELNSLQRKLSTAKQDLNSQRMLYKDGASSRSEYEKALTEYKEASNNVVKAKAEVNQAKLDVDKAQKELSYTKINAPISGVVVSLPVEVGQTLAEKDGIATIAEIDRMKIRAQISEADIYNIRAGQSATFTVVGNDREYPAEVMTVHPAPTYISDDSNNTSGSTYYYTDLDVKDMDKSFRVDMTATVNIATEKKDNVLAVSNTAITEKNGKKYVTLIKNGQQSMQEIQTGFSDNIKTEIISGLNEGDTVLREAVVLE